MAWGGSDLVWISLGGSCESSAFLLVRDADAAPGYVGDDGADLLCSGPGTDDELAGDPITGGDLVSSLRLLREVLRALLEGVPAHLSVDRIGQEPGRQLRVRVVRGELERVLEGRLGLREVALHDRAPRGGVRRHRGSERRVHEPGASARDHTQ